MFTVSARAHARADAIGALLRELHKMTLLAPYSIVRSPAPAVVHKPSILFYPPTLRHRCETSVHRDSRSSANGPWKGINGAETDRLLAWPRTASTFRENSSKVLARRMTLEPAG